MNRLIALLLLLFTLLLACAGCNRPADDPGDFLISMITAPIAVDQGVAFDFSYRISYEGTIPSEETVVSEYLSVDSTLDGSDDFLRSVPVESLAPDGFVDKTGNTSISSAGSYYILVIVDPGDLVDETDETNNSASVAATVSNPGIDLTPGTPYYTGEVGAGQTVSVTVPVINLGDDPATADFDVDLYLVDNTDLTLGTAITETVSTDVPGQGSIDVLISVTFSALLSNGDGVILYAEVDAAAGIAEIDETNNTNDISTVGGKLIGTSSPTFSIRFETFDTGGDVNTYMAIYRESDSVELFADFTGGSGSFAATTLSGLSSGDVLLVKVLSIDAGPYGFSARALNMSNPTNFIALTSNEDDPGEPDSGATVDTITGLTELVVGGGMSRFIEGNLVDDQDWFRVTIP